MVVFLGSHLLLLLEHQLLWAQFDWLVVDEYIGELAELRLTILVSLHKLLFLLLQVFCGYLPRLL